MDSRITVVKESGESEAFSPEKVRQAMRRSGLSGKEADEALKRLQGELFDGIRTRMIYGILYKIIDDMRPEVSHRYNLKRALQQIGPAGYPFEDFTARLLSHDGFETRVRQVLQGRCVTHEIDVVAERGGRRYLVECKFHNSPGERCRIQTALYVYARYLDLLEGAKLGLVDRFHKPWLATNTKFSNDVVKYAQCMDIPLLGWHHPLKDSIEARIERTKCFPVTVLKVGGHTLRQLLARGIVTVPDVPESPQRLSDISGMTLQTARKIVERAEYAR